ncbi:DUF4386 domain-containing protein [Tessaracoccus caeni]|uniref:DUF4386 domain-containing protein n=1 Tax=Tessaracoccus caeni TaxID=3031239 RepID=UPI0023DC5E63|nr:DUF4386 domain-containing protein [Tessaracoccus caeni]MDF1487476.1 DUF4386 domain-containing protein [Tessaracoccus caeni]
MATDRMLAATAGSLYLLTFVTSFPALALKESFLRGDGAPSSALWGAALEIVLAFACVGTAVAIHPVGHTRSPALSLGFVAARTVEASTIMVGVLALLSITTVRAGSGSAAEAALVALHDWAFLLGPGLLPSVNALLLGTLLYRHRLVPRVIPLVGLIGAPLLAISFLGTLFGVVDQVSPIAGALALPIALWELSVGLWLLIKGFSTGVVDGHPG